jgi:amidohydrolase
VSLDLIKFRRTLHSRPELSGKEKETAKIICTELDKLYPSAIITDLGGHGILAIYEFNSKGPGILLRCELDALPIDELNSFQHKSIYNNRSHKCGHDGHMAILMGVAELLSDKKYSRGRVLLLFQPAEETGRGAQSVLDDQKFPSKQFEFAFALHNLPGYPMHQILLSGPWFNATVLSMNIQFMGKTAHASEPEMGNNPSYVIANLIHEFKKLEHPDPNEEEFALVTIVHTKVGEKDYGISPAVGELHLTLRTWATERMESLKIDIEKAIERNSTPQNISYQFEYLEYFPAVKNDPECGELIIKASERAKLDFKKLFHPLRFGEDFAWFSQNYKSAMFGLGAGIYTPALHQDDYDFPDEIIESGISMFLEIIDQILG